MKLNKVIFFFSCLLFVHSTSAQSGKPFRLDSTSRVTDSTGDIIYPYKVWRQMLNTFRYTIKPTDSTAFVKGFILRKLSDEEYDRILRDAPKPNESACFKTGTEFMNFREKDLDDNKFVLKKLKGKVVVINFWFVNCPPCRLEIPHLNELVKKYPNDSSVVFLAICLDNSSTVKEFLKNTPFNYHQLTDMRYLTSTLGVKGYPTNVVLDKEGKIVFHSTGYSLGTIPWLERAIQMELDN